MKKTLLFIYSMLVTTQLFSQNTFPVSGNSGIGTITPVASLEIIKSYDADQNKALRMFYSGSWGHQTYARDFRFLDIESSEEGKVLQLNAFGMGLGYNPPGYNSSDRLYVNGNVGIGTSTIDNAQSWNKVLQLNGPSHAKLLVTEDSGVKVGIFSHGGYNGKIGTESNHNLTFTAGYWNDVMTLTTAGNVGIGILLPTEKLAVNGNIRAKEIKVETANWPDYVFARDYQLPTLQETEKHIKDKGHLPGIPSAEEVKANGIDLGEMNAKLLQKIEELTLHLIEKDKEIQSVKSDYQELKKMLIDIKAQK